MTDINHPIGVDVPGEAWPEGDLPTQGGGFTPTLMPGTSTFLLPQNLAQLWDQYDEEDQNPKSPTYKQIVKRNRVKFTREAPLVIADGPHAGETLTATYTSSPKRRGKATDPDAPWVSDLAYMLTIGLQDNSRPAGAEALKQRIIQYAGRPVRIEHGLSAQCRPDKVRYVIVRTAGPVGPDGKPTIQETTVQDPSGRKGCFDKSKRRADDKGVQGRYYTRDFKDPSTGEYMDTIECDCGAILRGFPQAEKFLPPVGAGGGTTK